MQSGMRRALLYGSAVPVLAALVWAGFVREADPDLGTLLSSIDVQLRLAAGMPAADAGGKPVAARVQLIEAASGHLQRARRIAPDSPIVAEFEGFRARLDGDHRAAAGHYRRARSLPGCEPEQRDTLVFNEARMLGAAGEHAAGLAVLTENEGNLQPAYRLQCGIERAGMLHRLGRDDEAASLLTAATASEQPLAWLQAGCLYAEMGRGQQAEAALRRAADGVPIADYHLARLKLTQGDADTSLRLLERAAKAAPAEVGRLLREDAAAWQVLAADARFVELTAVRAATPGR